MKHLNTNENLPTNTKPVFCVDCRHMRKAPKDPATCAAPGARMADLVTGYFEPRCNSMRRPHQECGQYGLLFEPINALERHSADVGMASASTPSASAISTNAGATR